MAPFSFLTAGRIVFGRGAAAQAAELIRPFGTRVLLVRGQSVAWVDTLVADLSAAGCDVLQVFAKGEPDVEQVRSAVGEGRVFGAQVVVAVGGGAVIDLGKATAALIPQTSDVMEHLEGVGSGAPLLKAPLPMAALPTTAGTGAEVTKNAVIAVPEAGRKVSLRDDRMLPDIALVDPALTDDCPREVTLASGFDALTQLIEPYLSSRANPMTDALVRAALPEGLKALARLARREDQGDRDHMAFAGTMGGLALANAGLGAVHGLAGVIGGRYAAPHGLVCARLLGPVLTANQHELGRTGANVDRFEEIARWIAAAFDLRSDQAFASLPDVMDDLGMPRLGDWMSGNADLVGTAQEAAGTSSMKANPCILDTPSLVNALQKAL